MQLTALASTVILSALAYSEAAPYSYQACWYYSINRCFNRWQGAWKREIASYPAVQFDLEHLRTITDELELSPIKVGKFFGFEERDESSSTVAVPTATGSAATDSGEASIEGLVLTLDAAGIEEFANATGTSLESLQSYFNVIV